MVKPNMYFVSSSLNPLLSSARATIGFENAIAAVAAKMVSGRQADHSTCTRIDAFCLLEDIPPAPARLDASHKMPEPFLLSRKSSRAQKIRAVLVYRFALFQSNSMNQTTGTINKVPLADRVSSRLCDARPMTLGCPNFCPECGHSQGWAGHPSQCSSYPLV